MAVYQAPDIKDRIAVGDDLYQIADSGGKKKLTPDPTEVTEAGTPINKALLQPMADAIQTLSTDMLPYNNYWWRIRQNAGSYNLRLVPSMQINGAYEESTASNGNKYYKVNILETWSRNNGDDNDGEYEDPRTIQIASSISVSSNGTISLVNPTSYSISGEDFYSQKDTYESRLSGKYVKGFAVSPDTIYKMPSSPDIQTWRARYTVSGETTVYVDYYLHASTVQVAVADYAATTSDYSYVSNEDENFYPHSGTQNGIEYQYLGRIFDVAVKAEPYKVQTINVTSASWNNRKYAVTILCTRYLLWMINNISSSKARGTFALVDSQKLYGINGTSASSASLNEFFVGFAPAGNSNDDIMGNLYMTFTTSGFELSYSTSDYSTALPLTIAYLPL